MGANSSQEPNNNNNTNLRLTEELKRNVSRSEGALLLFDQDMNSGTFPGRREHFIGYI